MTTDARRKLAEELLASGDMAPGWLAAFDAAPRSAFLPDVIWPFDHDTGETFTVSKSEDPAGWQRWADTDVALTTQWDDQATPHHLGTMPTSSSSAPSLVFAMFRDLDVQTGHRVLEVGTGTGWCAGLLSARVGAENVTSIEIDQAVSDQAAKALSAAGWQPRLVVGDGTAGYPDGAPYDRLLVTAGVRGPIPAAWLEQVRPGGIIVAPWGTHLANQDAIVRLVVAADGTASGRFTGGAEFMKVRSQRLDWPDHDEYVSGFGAARTSTTKLTSEVLADGFSAATFVVGLQVPDCTFTETPPDLDGDSVLWLYGLTDWSWAAVMRCSDGCPEFNVYQDGPRSLWEEVELAWRWWDQNGRPEVDEFGMTARPGRLSYWLQDESGPLGR